MSRLPRRQPQMPLMYGRPFDQRYKTRAQGLVKICGTLGGTEVPGDEVTLARDSNALHDRSSYGSFQRRVALPFEVDKDRVHAAFKSGAQTVTMERVNSPKNTNRKIPAQSSS